LLLLAGLEFTDVLDGHPLHEEPSG
jgi:hypothetical protein